jgi:DNA-binding NarL/FixJ family response regulator
LPIRVFLVEDTKQLQDVILELIASLGEFLLVGTATTEAEANLWLAEHPRGWDLAIIDLVLEQGTGMGVIAHCRRSAPDGKVVVFSDYVTPGIRKYCLKLGAEAAIPKADIPAFITYCTEVAAA